MGSPCLVKCWGTRNLRQRRAKLISFRTHSEKQRTALLISSPATARAQKSIVYVSVIETDVAKASQSQSNLTKKSMLYPRLLHFGGVTPFSLLVIIGLNNLNQ